MDWEDNKTQKPRSTLQITDILPNEADGKELHEQAVNFVMRLVVEEFESLRGLARYAPLEKNLHSVATSEVVPMEFLFRDEKYTSENVAGAPEPIRQVRQVRRSPDQCSRRVYVMVTSC